MTTLIDVAYCYTHGRAHPEVPLTPGDVHCRFEVWRDVVAGCEFQILNQQPTNEYMLHVLNAGSLAYIDTAGDGLVPCKVKSIDTNGVARVVVTATRGDWKRGGLYVIANPKMNLLSRDQVRLERGRPRIDGAVALTTDEGAFI